MSGRSSQNKGKAFERKVAADLRAIFPEAKRGFQTRGGTAEAPDVDGTPFYIECKAHKKVDREAAWQQIDDIAFAQRRIPLVVAKDDRQAPVARISIGALRDMISEMAEAGGSVNEYAITVDVDWLDMLLLLSERYGNKGECE